jgi:preprotein translocase subunit SecE
VRIIASLRAIRFSSLLYSVLIKITWPLKKPCTRDVNLIILLGKIISSFIVLVYSLDVVKVKDPYKREY